MRVRDYSFFLFTKYLTTQGSQNKHRLSLANRPSECVNPRVNVNASDKTDLNSFVQHVNILQKYLVCIFSLNDEATIVSEPESLNIANYMGT